jgi:hypothetical protein
VTERTGSLGARARAFASRIVARYGWSHAGLSPAACVFARVAPAARAPQRVVHRHTHLRFAPRIALAIESPAERGATETRGVTRPLARLVLFRSERIDRIERTRRELVDRVFARGVRHEHEDRPGARCEVSFAMPVQRVYRKPTVAAVVERDERPIPARVRTSSQAPRLALSMSEVDQLTETVVRSIDRRLSAARERRGRG